MLVEQLKYEELLRPGQVDPVLNPNEIPIHPAVYKSPSVYTAEFTNKVAIAVPDSIRRDLEVMKRVLGTDYNLEVKSDNEGINTRGALPGYKDCFKRFELTVYPEVHRLELTYMSSNTAVIPPRGERMHCIFQSSLKPHPMPVEKLRAYGYDLDNGKIDVVTWYIHNIYNFGLPVRMYFRNYAIMFNNLGLQEINK